LTGGQAADINQGKALIKDNNSEAVIANKGYDGDHFIAAIVASGAEPVIPHKSNRISKCNSNKYIYE
jgi:transposase